MDWNSIAPQLITAVVALAGSWIGLYWSNRVANARLEKELAYKHKEVTTRIYEERRLHSYETKREAYLKFLKHSQSLVTQLLSSDLGHVGSEKINKLYNTAEHIGFSYHTIKLVGSHPVIDSADKFMMFYEKTVFASYDEKERSFTGKDKVNADLKALTEDFFKKCHDDLNSFSTDAQAQ